MAELKDGYYIVHNAAAPNLVIDKEANGVVNGTNIWLWTKNNSDAQIIRVITANDGTRRMLFRDCGKAVDALAANITVNGTNVQVFDHNNTRAQKLYITSANTNVTYNGVSYETYNIKWTSGKCAKAASGTERANVTLQTLTTANLCRWFFEPVPSLKTGGSYRILSMMNTDYCLQIAGNSAANGANVNLGKYNGKPNQLWVIEDETGQWTWSIRNAQSGRYMDVNGAGAKDGTNVQIWDDNDTRAQRWNFHAYGTATYKGKQYPTYQIGSYVSEGGLDFSIDVKNAETKANTNVQIWSTNHAYNQLFMLVPTDQEDPTMPVPYNAALCSQIGEAGRKWQLSADVLYPTWWCSGAWAADGNNHYEYRFRRRSMASSTATWSKWGDWTDWWEASVQKKGQQSWLATGIPANIASGGANKWDYWRHSQIEFQVRSAGVNAYKLLHSKALDVTFDIFMLPDVTLNSAGWSADGLRIDYTSDYNHGLNYITVDDITVNNRSILNTRIQSPSAFGIIEVPASCFKEWPADGATIKVKYRVGYDQFPSMPYTNYKTLTVSYRSGTRSLSTRFGIDGLDAYCEVEDLGYTYCWASVGEDLFECSSAGTSGGFKRFSLPYPMGKPFNVFVSSYATNTFDVWGTDYLEHQPVKVIAHAWNFGDGDVCFLHKFTAMPTTEATYEATYQADSLDARPHESVSFTNTIRGTFSATGALLHDEDYSTLEDFERLMKAHHAIYRDINGGIRHVAITGITVTRNETYDTITVSMIEETV